MTAAAPGATPAHLFLGYYRRAAAWTAPQRANAPSPEPGFEDVARQFLELQDATEAHAALKALVEDKICSDADLRGRILAALKCIDQVFLQIHPRAVIVAGMPTPPDWLRDARTMRGVTGAYVEDTQDRLLPRGLLLRTPRHSIASSGDLLSDRYAALSVAPLAVEHDGRKIAVRVKVLPHDPFAGVSLAPRPAAEQVGFVPVATARGHIKAVAVLRGDGVFAAYGPAPGFDAATAAFDGLKALGDIDIAILPELCFSEIQIDQLIDMLRRASAPMPRLIVAGSYPTLATDADGQAWNECRILTGRGEELWRQRKIWPAGVNAAKAAIFALPDPGPDALIYEDNAAGNELVLADVEGIGRCVVLICQDCEMPVLAPALCTAYQPDWIFTPIFDCTIEPGRWAHARAFNLSQLSQARFLAVTNMAYTKIH